MLFSTSRLAKVCRKSGYVTSTRPAFRTARSKARRNERYSPPSSLHKTRSVASPAIVMTCSVSVKILFMGALQLAPCVAYAARTVITWRGPSTSLPGRLSNAPARNPVYKVASTSGYALFQANTALATVLETCPIHPVYRYYRTGSYNTKLFFYAGTYSQPSPPQL